MLRDGSGEASRGTRLRRVMRDFRFTCSRYSPARTSTVVFAAGADGGVGIARVTLHGALNFGGGDSIGQSIAAEEQGAFSVEGNALDLDEVSVVGLVFFGANIAEDLIAARVAHGFSFADLALVFALADWGMIVRDLADLAAAEMVEARIAHVADDGSAVFKDGAVFEPGSIFEHGHGEHKSHAFPFGIGARGLEDFVIGDSDGFADALFGAPPYITLRAAGKFSTYTAG